MARLPLILPHPEGAGVWGSAPIDTRALNFQFFGGCCHRGPKLLGDGMHVRPCMYGLLVHGFLFPSHQHRTSHPLPGRPVG